MDYAAVVVVLGCAAYFLLRAVIETEPVSRVRACFDCIGNEHCHLHCGGEPMGPCRRLRE